MHPVLSSKADFNRNHQVWTSAAVLTMPLLIEVWTIVVPACCNEGGSSTRSQPQTTTSTPPRTSSASTCGDDDTTAGTSPSTPLVVHIDFYFLLFTGRQVNTSWTDWTISDPVTELRGFLDLGEPDICVRFQPSKPFLQVPATMLDSWRVSDDTLQPNMYEHIATKTWPTTYQVPLGPCHGD